MYYTFIVVGNIGEHSGFVSQKDATDIWDNENQSGWTYQQITRQYGSVIGEYDNVKEANECLDRFLGCDSGETNTYCYSHNPHPSE